MLIKEEELNRRLNNPLNLMNRLRKGELSPRRSNAMSLFIPNGNTEGSTGSGNSGDEVKSNLPATVFKNPFKPAIEVIPSDRPQLPEPSSDELVEDIDTKIKLTQAHDNALGLLNDALLSMKEKLPEMKPSGLVSAISASSKVIESIRKERLEREKNNKSDENIHYHFYCPTPRKINDYDVIEVTG